MHYTHIQLDQKRGQAPPTWMIGIEHGQPQSCAVFSGQNATFAASEVRVWYRNPGERWG